MSYFYVGKKSNFSLALLLLSISCFSHFALSYYNTGYQIRDLERNDAGFELDGESWNATKIRSGQVLVNKCGNDYLVGGINVLGQDIAPFQSGDYFTRTYNNLPPHTMIYYSFTFYQVDTWNTVDYFQVQVDNNIVSAWTGYNYLTFPSNLCGTAGYNDISLRMFGRVVHTANYMTFRLVSRFDQVSTNEAIGLRNVNILIVSSPSTTTANMCTVSPVSAGSFDCGCSEGQYQDSSGNCQTCNGVCSSCFGGGANQCYECNSGYSFDGTSCFQCASNCVACTGTGSSQCSACQTGYLLFNNNTCVASSDCGYPLIKTFYETYCESPCGFPQYVYWNQSCSNNCDSALQQTTLFGLVKKCIYPCTNSLLPYLYWTGNCRSSCNPPLKIRNEGGTLYCDYPCEKSSDYLFANGTCGSLCPSPFTRSLIEGKNLCNYGCIGSNYLYWQGSCLSCPLPLVSRLDGGKRFCVYPCDSNEYLYWNGSCMYTCPYPLTTTLVYTKNLCQNTCSGYLYGDGSCQASCLAPYVPRLDPGVSYCDLFCPSDKPFLFEDGTCISSCNFPLKLITNSSGTFCLPPCDNTKPYYDPSAKVCLASCNSTQSIAASGLYKTCDPYYAPTESVSLLKVLHYVPYLDIELPVKLRGISVMRATNVLSLRLDPKTLWRAKQKFSILALPSVFANSFVFSSFVANFYDDLILLCIILGSGVVFLLLEWFAMCTECQNAQFSFERLRVLTLVNLPIMLFATNIGDIIFFSSLDFRSYDSSQPSAVTSVVVAVIMLILIAAIFGAASCLVYGAQEVKLSASPEPYSPYAKYLERWASFQVLFRGYRDTNWFTQSFYLLYCVRVALPMFAASFFYGVPLLQVCIYLCLSIATLLYLVFVRPIKKEIDHLNLLLLELILLIVNTSLLALTILDAVESTNQSAKDFLAEVILTADFCLSVLAVTALIAKIGFGAQQAFRFRKEKSPQELSSWLQLLFLPIQQGCFGFEQVQIGRFVNKPKSKSVAPPAYTQRIELTTRNNYVENRNLLENTVTGQNRTLSDMGVPATFYNNSHVNNNASYMMENTADSFPINKISQKDRDRDRGNYSQLSLPNANISDAFPIQKMARKKKTRPFTEDL